MPFKKQDKNINRIGRPKGVPNRTTISLKHSIKNFLNDNWPEVQQSFDKLSAKEKLNFIEKLLKYELPTLSSVDASMQLQQNLGNLSNEKLDNILSNLKQQIDNEANEN